MQLPFLKKKKTPEEEQEPEEPQVNPEYKKNEQEYQRNVVIVTSVPLVKKIGLIAWIVFDVVLVGAFIVYLGLYFADGMFRDKRLIARNANNVSVHDLLTSDAAAPLEIGEPRVFASGDGRYDVYAEVTNDNTQWYATFNYQFTYSQGESDIKSGFVMMNSSVPMIEFFGDYESRPSNVDLVISDLEWHRVDGHTVPDAQEWLQDHESIEYSNVEYGPATNVKGAVASLSFTATNNSPYSYWEFPIMLVLERSGAVAAVNQTTISGFESGESRNITVNWFGSAPASGSIQFIPYVNYFDNDVYMAGDGENAVDVRELF